MRGEDAMLTSSIATRMDLGQTTSAQAHCVCIIVKTTISHPQQQLHQHYQSVEIAVSVSDIQWG